MFQAKDLKHSNTLLLSHAPCHENVVHLVESFGMALCFFPLEDVGGIYTFQVLHRRTLLRLFLYTVLYHMCFVFCCILYCIISRFEKSMSFLRKAGEITPILGKWWILVWPVSLLPAKSCGNVRGPWSMLHHRQVGTKVEGSKHHRNLGWLV